ncbi:MAG: glycerol-3-phosphate 1-O-acyltransferase PlsY [Rhodobacterales bacterium]|nr:glycerol-3-phosphate 1-O-acyltransferase PlsY [Rhodobacterales bacterium]NCT11257.1 glycerol-3-phosphate 1-O-acyltransferase PlsY [Rhodobacterales bacterium]
MPVIENSAVVLTLWATLGYLLGSVPFGVLLARVFGLGDLRKIGSGNIGATNVLRTGNKRAAALTLLLDGGKGAVAVLAARWLAGEDAAQLAALAAFIGHCFPIWLGFRGGKGVATFLGIMLALAWPVGLAACATWVLVAAVMRYSSLAALMAAGMSPVWAAFLGRGEVMLLAAALAILIYARHWGNIARLRAGTEPRIGAK